MIALSIGIIVTLAVSVAYISGSRLQGSQSELLTISESGRSALLALGTDIVRAGYRNGDALYFSAPPFPPGTQRVTGTDSNSTVDTSTDSYPSDTISISYYGENDLSSEPPAAATPTNTADESMRDCHGELINRNIRADITYGVVTISNVPWLYCTVTHTETTGGTATSTDICATPSNCGLVANVEALQFLYGVDSDEDGIINIYERGENLTDETREQITSVQVSLVVKGDSPTTREFSKASDIDMFGYEYTSFAENDDIGSTYAVPATDGHARRVFVSEFFLRNRG